MIKRVTHRRAAFLFVFFTFIFRQQVAFATDPHSDKNESQDITCRQILEKAYHVGPWNAPEQTADHYRALIGWINNNYNLVWVSNNQYSDKKQSILVPNKEAAKIWNNLKIGLGEGTTTLKLEGDSIVYTQVSFDGKLRVLEFEDIPDSTSKSLVVTEILPPSEGGGPANVFFTRHQFSYALVPKATTDVTPSQDTPPPGLSRSNLLANSHLIEWPANPRPPRPTESDFDIAPAEAKKLIQTISEFSKYRVSVVGGPEQYNYTNGTLTFESNASEHHAYVAIKRPQLIENFYINDNPKMGLRDNKLEIDYTEDPREKMLMFTDAYSTVIFRIRLEPKSLWLRFLDFSFNRR